MILVPVLLGACRPEVPGLPPPPPTSGPSTSETVSGGQSGEDPGYGSCPTSSSVVGPDEVLVGPDGPFTAADLIGLAEGVHEAVLTWSDDQAVTALLADLAWDGEIRLVEPAPGSSSTSGYCRSWIEVDGTFWVQTADGRLDAAGEAVLVGYAASGADFEGPWDDGGDLLTVAGRIDGDGLSGLVRSEAGVLATIRPPDR